MAYISVPVPSDLSRVKSKVLFNLTKRQLFCFGCGALIGVPLFFLLKEPLGVSPASMCMMLVLIPAMLFGLYEKNSQPLEKILKQIIRVSFLRPKARPYRTQNFYATLLRQEQLNQEVRNIVQKAQKTNAAAKNDKKEANKGRTKRDPRRH